MKKRVILSSFKRDESGVTCVPVVNGAYDHSLSMRFTLKCGVWNVTLPVNSHKLVAFSPDDVEVINEMVKNFNNYISTYE